MVLAAENSNDKNFENRASASTQITDVKLSLGLLAGTGDNCETIIAYF